MTPDVNVLVAASRSDHPHHKTAAQWLRGALQATQSGGSFLLLPMVAASVLRLVTSPRIFVNPSPVTDALQFISSLRAVSGVRTPDVGSEWPQLHALCLDQGLSANAIPDAWIAACVLHLGDHLVTFDRDFKKLLPARMVTVLPAKA